MNEQLNKLKEMWRLWNITLNKGVSTEEIIYFESKHHMKIPKDLANFFIFMNGTNETYDQKLFQFNSLHQFKNVNEELKDQSGIPDYSNIDKSLPDSEAYYLLADHSFFICCYAIRLYPEKSTGNDVIVIWGDKYKKIANSFSEFMDMYLSDSIEIFPN